MAYSTSSSKNALSQIIHDTNSRASQPPDEADRISYGIISDVDDASGQIKIRLYEGSVEDNQPTLSKEILGGAYIPLLNEPIDIVHKYGMLRTGLVVRVHWRGGRIEPNWAIAEIIGTEKLNIFTKDPQSNQLDIGAWKIFSGGVIG